MAENENDENQRIKRLTIKMIKEKKPETIVQLISLVRKEENIPAERLFIIIQELEDEKNLQFEESFFPESTAEYVFSIRATWYWVILLLSILTAFFVFSIPDNMIPQIYARSALGIMFVLYFPGYAIIKAIYPINVPLELRSVILDNIERIVLSLGLSSSHYSFDRFDTVLHPFGSKSCSNYIDSSRCNGFFFHLSNLARVPRKKSDLSKKAHCCN